MSCFARQVVGLSIAWGRDWGIVWVVMLNKIPAIGLFAALCSAVLMVLAFPPFGEATLAWVAMVPVIWALHSRRMIWWQLWVGGTACWLGQLWWIGYVTWVGVVLLCVYLGLYWLVWGRWMAMLFRFFPTRDSLGNVFCALLGATGWAALEEVRGWLFTGLPWNNLGVSQYNNAALIQTAAIGGVELLSWVMMVIQIVIALTVLRLIGEVRSRGRMRAHWEFTGALALLGVIFIYGVTALTPSPQSAAVPSISVGLVQGNVPQDVKFSPMSLEETILAYTVPTSALAGAEPDVIIWPETATGYGVFQHPMVGAAVLAVLEENGIPILAGSVEVGEEDRLYNAALLLVPGMDATAIRATAYKKQHLVPFGEFLPGREFLPWLGGWLDMPVDYFPGQKSSGLLPIPGREITPLAGMLICFEDIMPRLARARALAGAQLLVNITNDGWFRDSPAAYAHMTNAIFRSVENRIPMIRATNTGVTCVITPEGIIAHILEDAEGRHTAVSGAMTVKVPIPGGRKTFYQLRGHLFGEACAVVTGCFLLLALRLRKHPAFV